MTAAERAEALDRLVAQQARDDARQWAPRSSGLIRESEMESPGDLEWSLDRVAGRDPEPHEVLAARESLDRAEGQPLRPGDLAAIRYVQATIGVGVVGVGLVWTAEVVAYDAAAPCPACDGRLARGAVCICCSATWENPHRHPMAGTPTRARRTKSKGKSGKTLAGGTGKVKPKAVKVAKSKPKVPAKRSKRADPWKEYFPAAW